MPISRSALISRLNRRLRDDGEVLRTTRSDRARIDLGDHYVIDVSRNAVLRTHVDLLELADDVGLRLLPHEREVRAA